MSKVKIKTLEWVSVCCALFFPCFCSWMFKNRFPEPIAATKVCTDMSQEKHTREEKMGMYTKHADRLLVFMIIPSPKSQIDFRIYRIDFCPEAVLRGFWWESPCENRKKSKSTFHHPVWPLYYYKGIRSKSRSVLLRPTLYRGPVA